MSKTRVVAVLAVAASLAALAVLAGGAAAKPARPQASGQSPMKLGFITKFPVDFFFVLQNAAKRWDKAHKDATVLFAQGKSATDDAGEIAAIQDMVAKGVKGIAITPTSPAVTKELDKAVKKGVKIVLVDNDIPSWKKKTSVVATNNYKGGLLAGRYLAKRLKAGDTLGILEGVPGVPALDDRVRGMLAGMGPLRTKIKIVARLATDCAQDKGLTAAQDILTRESDVTAIYAACGPPALGAVQALKNARKKKGEVILVGFDALPDEVAQIRAGWETASVAQFPAKMGFLGIDTTYRAVKGEKVPKNVDTGTALVTRANAGKFGG